MKIISRKVSNLLFLVTLFSISLGFHFTKVSALSLTPKGCIDTPATGVTLQGVSDVKGWFLDANGVSKIEVLVDGNSVGTAQLGIARPDVANAYPAYQNANAGYLYTLNTNSLSNGKHTISVKETGNNGLATVIGNQKVTVQNLSVRGTIDSPSAGATVNGQVNVRGWALDGSGVKTIEVSVDGNSVGTAQLGIARPDVANAYPAYQNANAGYLYTLNTNSLSNGQHTISVKETGNNGVATVIGNQKINVQNLSPRGSIDTPANNATIMGKVTVSGWFLDGNGVNNVKVLVDGNSVGTAQYGNARPDVANVFPAYQNTNSGYQYTLNTASLSNGQHTITVKETGNNGVANVIGSQQVNVQNLPAKGSIDTPAINATIKGQVTVSGWFLDGSGVNSVEVLVDGNSVGAAQYGNARPDVANAYPAYQNANSGYQYTLDTTNFADGKHTLTVKETGINGATSSISETITVFNNPYTLVDLRKPADLTAADIRAFFNQYNPNSPLKADAQYFIDAQNKYGVNAQYLVAHAIEETGWGSPNSDIYTYKHNLFGYGAYDVAPFTCALYFPSDEDSIYYEAQAVREDYLDSTGTDYNGPNLQGMNVKYASDSSWADNIAAVMAEIKPYEAAYYSQASILPEATTPLPSYGRNIPDGQPVPTDIYVNFAAGTTATVTNGGSSLPLRTIPYASTSTVIESLSSGTVVQVLGYNTDVEYQAAYPYNYRWYRVLVNNQEGWLYGGGITTPSTNK